MPSYILDANVLLQNPELLTRAGPSTEFIIPEAVVQELRRAATSRSGVRQLLELIDSLGTDGSVQIARLGPGTASAQARPISGDVAIALIASEAKQRGQDVVVATNDRELWSVGSTLGVRTVDSSALMAMLESTPPTTNTNVLERARKIVGAQHRGLLIGVLVGIGISLAANAAALPLATVASKVNIWGTVIGVTIIAAAAYWARGRYRLAYGTAEVCIGFSTAIRVFWPKFDYNAVAASELFQIAAGNYIMVRGLDNIGRALEDTRWGSTWRRFSGERTSG